MCSLAVSVAFFACALADVDVAQQGTFLQAGELSEKSAKLTLDAELHPGSAGEQRLREFEDALRPIYRVLPKNPDGNLGHRAVRYVLHRLFVARHGWYIRGLEPGGESQEWVPSFLQDKLEGHAGSTGIDVHDLAVLAAALEDLIVGEGNRRLEQIYTAANLPRTGTVNRTQAEGALTTYLIVYLVGGNFTYSNQEEILLKQEFFASKYAGWDGVKQWLLGIEHTALGDGAPPKLDFSSVQRVAAQVSASFGSWNDIECRELKTMLLEMVGRSRKAGRVRLADFYKKGLYSRWSLSEKAEYLKLLGALDLTNASNPMVIVSNYLMSRPNCLEASSLYAVCCRNECEDLMGVLEREIAAPSATPERIAQLVSDLPSPTVATPRELMPSQLSKLEEVAALHGGHVSLHGRLFAQWMHHAFPNECPYPHVAGTTSPLSASDWVGEESNTEEELRRYVDADVCSTDGPAADAAELADLPWSDTEELLMPLTPSDTASSSSSFRRIFRRIVLLGMLVAVVLLAVSDIHRPRSAPACLRRIAELGDRCGVRWQFPVVGLLILLAVVTGVLDKSVFGVAVIGGVLALLAVKTGKLAEKRLPL